MKKYVLLLVGIFVFCAVLTGCELFDDDVSRDRIIEYVGKNHEILESVANGRIASENAETEAWIRDRLGKRTIVKSVYRYRQYHGVLLRRDRLGDRFNVFRFLLLC